MAQKKNSLTAITIKTAQPGRLLDGSGLMLEKNSEDSGKWVYRYSFAQRRRDMGLGSWPEVSLADARRSRDRWAAVLLSGKDPISERNRIREQELAEINKRDPFLEEVAREVFEARKPSLRGGGTRGRWFSPIERHILPKLGKRRLSTITTTDIKQVLAPLWRTKTATAEKAVGRLEMIFEHAKLEGLPADPFTVQAAKHVLGDLKRDVTHIPSTPWQEIPDLYASLSSHTGSSYDCRASIRADWRKLSGRASR